MCHPAEGPLARRGTGQPEQQEEPFCKTEYNLPDLVPVAIYLSARKSLRQRATCDAYARVCGKKRLLTLRCILVVVVSTVAENTRAMPKASIMVVASNAAMIAMPRSPLFCAF